MVGTVYSIARVQCLEKLLFLSVEENFFGSGQEKTIGALRLRVEQGGIMLEPCGC
jgi:hypothetical protein